MSNDLDGPLTWFSRSQEFFEVKYLKKSLTDKVAIHNLSNVPLSMTLSDL